MNLHVWLCFLFVKGKIIGKDDFLMSGAENTSEEKIISAFLKQYYTGPRHVPVR